MGWLDAKRALVAGAGSGIGRAVLAAFGAEGDDLRVESALLLFRSRGDTREPSLISAGRTDVLRATADGLRLARREITVDESVLRTQNLAVFL